MRQSKNRNSATSGRARRRDLPLNRDALRRIHKTLIKRQRRAGDLNLIAIGFGIKRRRGKVVEALPDDIDVQRAVVRYYVRRKPASLAQIPKRRRIPPVVRVRLRWGEGYRILQFRTDVVELGELFATGADIFLPADRPAPIATTGVGVRWLMEGVHWGVVTVRHAVGTELALAIATVNGERAVSNRLIRARGAVDAVLAEVSNDQLNQIIGRPILAGDPALSVRMIDDLRTDADINAAGISYPRGGKFEFRVDSWLPNCQIPGIGRMNNVVQVSAERGSFRRGRSGSGWRVVGRAAAMQNASDQATFSLGFGQALEEILTDLSSVVGAVVQPIAIF